MKTATRHCSITSNASAEVFWSTFGRSLRNAARARGFDISSISSQRDFLDVFGFHDSQIVVIDEFSKLYAATWPRHQLSKMNVFGLSEKSKTILNSMLVAAGTFGIVRLNTTSRYLSPFNITDYVQSPYFSLEETRYLFQGSGYCH